MDTGKITFRRRYLQALVAALRRGEYPNALAFLRRTAFSAAEDLDFPPLDVGFELPAGRTAHLLHIATSGRAGLLIYLAALLEEAERLLSRPVEPRENSRRPIADRRGGRVARCGCL